MIVNPEKSDVEMTDPVASLGMSDA